MILWNLNTPKQTARSKEMCDSSETWHTPEDLRRSDQRFRKSTKCLCAELCSAHSCQTRIISTNPTLAISRYINPRDKLIARRRRKRKNDLMSSEEILTNGRSCSCSSNPRWRSGVEPKHTRFSQRAGFPLTGRHDWEQPRSLLYIAIPSSALSFPITDSQWYQSRKSRQSFNLNGVEGKIAVGQQFSNQAFWVLSWWCPPLVNNMCEAKVHGQK